MAAESTPAGTKPALHPEEKALRDMRRVGIALLLGGMFATAFLERLAKQRARIREARRRALVAVETPGSLLTQAGVALLEATNRPDKSL
jgi:hypothetical protein